MLKKIEDKLSQSFLHAAHIFDELLILDSQKMFRLFQGEERNQHGFATDLMRRLYRDSVSVLGDFSKHRVLVQAVPLVEGQSPATRQLMIVTSVPEKDHGQSMPRLIVAKIKKEDVFYPGNLPSFAASHPFESTTFVCAGEGASAVSLAALSWVTDRADRSCERLVESLLPSDRVIKGGERLIRLEGPGVFYATPISSAFVETIDGFGRQASGHDVLMNDWWMVAGASERQLQDAVFAVLLLPRFVLLASFLPVDFGFYKVTSLWRQRRAFLHQLQYKASHDPLTGLLGRGEMCRLIELLMNDSARRAKGAAIVLIDIDHFKDINDSFGHIAGDKVIGAVAERIQSLMRQDHLVARFGGDELIALLPGLSAEASALKRATDIRRACSRPIHVDSGLTCRITVSLGVAVLAADQDVEEWISRADHALYRAKRGGRNCVASLHGVYVPQEDDDRTVDGELEALSPDLELLQGGVDQEGGQA